MEVEGQKEDLPPPRHQHLEELAEGWWHAKIEGGREKFAVDGGFTSTASGPQIPDMKADCWSAESATVSEEVNEEVPLLAAEGTKVEEGATG